MSKTLPPSAMGRAAIESRRVKAELPEPHRVAVRCRAVVRDMMFSEHWIWRDGEQHFLPAGLRFLADAHAHESDSAAAVVCRRLADELEQAEQHIPKLAADMAKAGGRVDLTQPEIYAEMERRGFA